MQVRYPSLYQINTRLYLNHLSAMLGRQATFDDFTDYELDRWVAQGFAWIWLLGVWQVGSASRQLARATTAQYHEYQKVLPDLRVEDICGSCFAISGYTVNPDLGGESALKRLRERMRQRGLRLMLDFIPNHTGSDHPWVRRHPEFYIPGRDEDLKRKANFYGLSPYGNGVFAYGRDPLFPGWTDTFQLNYANPELQEAMIAELLKIADLSDGVRCDMAMLILPEVFERTWGLKAEPFWPKAIPRVRNYHPGFLFLAEVYWDLEWTLQLQGFDFTYDKRLYDFLVDQQVQAVRKHLHTSLEFQERMTRILENHDEQRAAEAFPNGVHQAAAVINYFIPGMRFFHQGQLEGRQVRIPVQLCRGTIEPVNLDLEDFYQKLLEVLQHPALHQGTWQLLEPQPAWDSNWTWDCFIAFAWENEPSPCLVGIVNYSNVQSQCYLRLPCQDLAGKKVHLIDLLSSHVYERAGDDLLEAGLYLDLPPWGYHLFEVRISG